ncbi:hypothetical protein H2200_000178 [Cladophialophora chaetospira]|uniref:Uncharacterized protein n=1 Tax=Cladophialophora chaetospira TaxID=386627 RepID=A0AA38XMX8_9EURO|nr:hypothetical protein H2200_000178 [Cladophialophora chaetospira]
MMDPACSVNDAGCPSKKRHIPIRTVESPRPLSTIEGLPTELLEQLFLGSGNGNLLIAAPSLAVRLSGSETVRKLAFLIAFYPHQLSEVVALFELTDYMCSMEFGSWDIRSMTKAVLGSRWCTCGWVRDFIITLHELAIDDTLAVLEAGRDFIGFPKEELAAAKWHELGFQARLQRVYNTDPLFPLEFFDFDITFSFSMEYDDPRELSELFLGLPWPDMVFRQFQWRFCGGARFPPRYAFEGFSRQSPFRELVEAYAMSMAFGREPFAGLQRRMQNMTRESSFACLSRGLAVDYFFWPEQDPFKVDPMLFRLAALAEMQANSASMWDARQCMLALCTADPESLPLEDPVIDAYSVHLHGRIADEKRKRILFRDRLREKSRNGTLTDVHHLLGRYWQKRSIVCSLADHNILAHILLSRVCPGTEPRRTGCQHQKDPKLLTFWDKKPPPCSVSAYVAEESEKTLKEKAAAANAHLSTHNIVELYKLILLIADRQGLAVPRQINPKDLEDLKFGYSEEEAGHSRKDGNRLLHNREETARAYAREESLSFDWVQLPAVYNHPFFKALKDQKVPVWKGMEPGFPVWFRVPSAADLKKYAL